MKKFWFGLILTMIAAAVTGWALSYYQYKQRITAALIAESTASKADPTRESLIESLSTPEMRAYAAKQDAAYQLWAESQISGICSVHHAKMRRKWLPVQYGLPDLSELPTKEESAANFPFPDEGFLIGPCTGGNIHEEEVHICDECTEAYNKWLTEPRKRLPN